MYERMFGDALHTDRLQRATWTMRVCEAERLNKAAQSVRRQRRYREAVARTLVALAMRIAPTVTQPNSCTPMLAQ